MTYSEVHEFPSNTILSEADIIQILKEEGIPEHHWAETIKMANRICECCLLQPVHLFATKLTMCESCQRDHDIMILRIMRRYPISHD